MRKDKSFPWTAVMIFVVFGLLCFVGGFLASNITNKKQLHVAEVRLSECENKFLEFSKKVMANTDAAVEISEGVASVWNNSIRSGSDFNDKITEFLEQNKRSISSLKLNNDLIEIQIPELKKYVSESKNEYDAVMQLYDVYKKLYDLGMTPAGTLEGFNSSRENLVNEYKNVQGKVFVYMPVLQNALLLPDSIETVEDVPDVQPWEQTKPVEKVKTVENIKPFDKAVELRPGFDPRIKKIVSNMTYRQVESSVGVPRDKKKDSQGREVWIYPSEKAGFRNVVYFASGKVLQSRNLPLNSSID